jgi:phage-related tail protein
MLSADAIRESGQTVVAQIRELGQQAKREGEEVAAYAEEIANALTAAHEEMAGRVAEYMQKCQAARASMQEHKEALTVIPPRANPVAEQVGEAAVAHALDRPVPKFLTQGPRHGDEQA